MSLDARLKTVGRRGHGLSFGHSLERPRIITVRSPAARRTAMIAIAGFGDGVVCQTPRLWGHLQIRRETVREPDVDQERDLMVVCAGTGAARLPPPEAWPVPVA